MNHTFRIAILLVTLDFCDKNIFKNLNKKNLLFFTMSY